MKLLIKETLRDVFVISTHSETIGVLVTSPHTFKDQNDSWWGQFLVRIYLPRGRTLDYQGALPLGTRGLIVNTKTK
jgi:hypothetical protein